jgi:sulfur-carrier protein adenylyltransferase/sulfurtransferase
VGVVVLVGGGPLADAVGDRLRAAGHELVATPALTEGRTFDLLLEADLLLDASSDAGARYLADDAAEVRGIPLVWADDVVGEAGVAFDEAGVDYRDLRAPGEAPVPHPGAPIGALADAAAQLAEAILRDPDVAGTVRVWDGAGFAAATRFVRTAGAPRPGSLDERTTIPEPDETHSITAPQLAKLLAGSTTLGVHEPVPVLLDVREAPEVSFASLPDAVHIPLGQLPERLGELDPTRPLVVYCHHGVRSSRALGMLERSGFTRVRHLTGGIDAWSVQVDPELPRY